MDNNVKMKEMKKIILPVLMILLPFVARAQDVYSSVLSEIENNSLTLAAIRSQADAQKQNVNTGRFLENPEVGFAYLWGEPSSIGNRHDINVTQSFDFPSVYARKSNIAAMRSDNIELLYRNERNALLLEARNVCVQLVYYNALAKEYENRLKNAKDIADAYASRFANGAINAIENNKAQINLETRRGDLSRINVEREALLAQLKSMNGGKSISFDVEEFVVSRLPNDFESWYANVEASYPLLQYMEGETGIATENVKLSNAMSLPKLSAGYMSENVVGENFRGIAVGVSIPLWENKNTIKQAKAEALASQNSLSDTKVSLYNDLKRHYDMSNSLRQTAARLRSTVEQYDNMDLLSKAIDAGEMSLLEYLLEIQYYYDAYDAVLEAERDAELAYSEIWIAEQ